MSLQNVGFLACLEVGGKDNDVIVKVYKSSKTLFDIYIYGLLSFYMSSPQVSLLLLLCVGVQSGPDVQLADFQDLFRLATGGMAGREDRSLLNTYPFNHVASQVSK